MIDFVRIVRVLLPDMASGGHDQHGDQRCNDQCCDQEQQPRWRLLAASFTRPVYCGVRWGN